MDMNDRERKLWKVWAVAAVAVLAIGAVVVYIVANPTYGLGETHGKDTIVFENYSKLDIQLELLTTIDGKSTTISRFYLAPYGSGDDWKTVGNFDLPGDLTYSVRVHERGGNLVTWAAIPIGMGDRYNAAYMSIHGGPDSWTVWSNIDVERR